MSVRECLFFFQAEDGIRYDLVTGVQTCALPISRCQGILAQLAATDAIPLFASPRCAQHRKELRLSPRAARGFPGNEGNLGGGSSTNSFVQLPARLRGTPPASRRRRTTAAPQKLPLVPSRESGARALFQSCGRGRH